MTALSMSQHPNWWRYPLITLLVVIAAAPVSLITSAKNDAQPSFELYLADDSAHQEYRQLDPMTLNDMADAEPLRFDHVYTHVAVSADGSTFVVIDPSQGPLEAWISVRDRIDGVERLTIDVEEAVYSPWLSTDGSRLVVQSGKICGPHGCGERVWYTYDTHTGDLLSTTRSELNHYVWPDMLAPDGRHLFVPFYEGPPEPSYPATPTPSTISKTGPWPLQIATYDLTTGEEVARTTVPDVFAGSWLGEETIADYSVGQTVHPAIALSPDGTRIAVIDAAMRILTLIDTETLDVTATHSIHESRSLANRALEWLGIVPQTAEAKISEGRWLSGTFSADGDHLYVTGNEMEVGDTIEDITGHGFGVLRIDGATGKVTESALEGHDASQLLMPSPDGASLYVLAPEVPWWEDDGQSPAYVLRRLDAATLEPLAERTIITGWPSVLLLPTSGKLPEG